MRYARWGSPPLTSVALNQITNLSRIKGTFGLLKFTLERPVNWLAGGRVLKMGDQRASNEYDLLNLTLVATATA